MKKIFKKVDLSAGWKKVTLKEHNDFYLIAVKKDKACKKDTLDKDCVKKIRFELAVESGVKGKYLIHSNQINLFFGGSVSSDAEFGKVMASTKVLGCPSTFYIRAVDMTGVTSTVTEGCASIEVYMNELRLK